MRKPSLVNDSSERGSTMVEYALLVTLVALASIASITPAGSHASNTFNRVGLEVARANNAGGNDGTGSVFVSVTPVVLVEPTVAGD